MAYERCCPSTGADGCMRGRQLLGLSATSPEVPPWPVKLQAPSHALTLHAGGAVPRPFCCRSFGSSMALQSCLPLLHVLMDALRQRRHLGLPLHLMRRLHGHPKLLALLHAPMVHCR